MDTKQARLDRITTMGLLYQYDFYGSDDFCKDGEVSNQVLEKYYSILERLDEIDQIIINNLYDYSLKVLNIVDRSIIRLAVYEFLTRELAAEIIINEALEITKEFSELDDEKQHRFTNKVLDNIYKSLSWS